MQRVRDPKCILPCLALANLKGMFLYARILLSSIEFLDDIQSIREELRVLPKDLEDA